MASGDPTGVEPVSVDDELRSVRIEVEGGPVAVDTPETLRSAGGPSRWFLAGAFVLGLVVIFGLLAMSPDGGASADGTERAAPTTTVPEVVPEPEAVEPVAQEPPVLISDVGGVNELGFGIDDIVSAGVGYLALAPNQGPAPQLFRSVDGVNWTPIDNVVVDGDPIDLFDRRWRDLVSTDEGFSVTATGQFLFQREVYVSARGTQWQEADDLSEALGDRSRPIYPVFTRGNSVTGFQLQRSAILSEILVEHTNLDERERGFCGAFRGRGEEPTFQIMDCAFNSAGSLTADRIESDLAAEQIFACVESLPDNGISSEFVQTVVEADDGVSLDRFGAAGGFAADIVSLDDARVVFLDGVFPPSNPDACDGVVDTPQPGRPQVSIVDLEGGLGQAGVVAQFDLPAELENALTSNGSQAVRAFGTASVGAAFASHVLFVGGEDVWAMEIQSGMWTALLRSNPDRPREPFDVSRIEVVGDRIFVLSGARVVIFDLAAGDGGEIEVDRVETVGNPDFADDFTDGEFVFADATSLFVTDGRSIWRYDVAR